MENRNLRIWFSTVSIKFIFWVILIFLPSCEITNLQQVSDIDKLIKKNNQKITVSTGVSGTLLKKEGDCMPSYPPNKSCKEYPISRTIIIYEYCTIENIVAHMPGPLFDAVNSKLIGQCNADNEGFFQLTLTPGKYSIFIKEDDKFYADGFDGQGGITPVTVKSDSVSIVNLILDYADY